MAEHVAVSKFSQRLVSPEPSVLKCLDLTTTANPTSKAALMQLSDIFH